MAGSTQYIGRAGEFAVASQLLLRGVPVSFPAVDAGYDLLAGQLRIQVKTARKFRHRVAGSWGYVFNIGVSKWDSHTRHFYKARAVGTVDFYVLWGVDENRFWIVPAHALTKNMIRIVDSSKRHSVDVEAIQALLNTGLQQREVAQRLGFSEMSVSRVASGQLPKTEPGNCKEVTAREGAWHEIISALGLVNSIDQSEEEITV